MGGSSSRGDGGSVAGETVAEEVEVLGEFVPDVVTATSVEEEVVTAEFVVSVVGVAESVLSDVPLSGAVLPDVPSTEAVLLQVLFSVGKWKPIFVKLQIS